MYILISDHGPPWQTYQKVAATVKLLDYVIPSANISYT
jgi:hypothetical protein